MTKSRVAGVTGRQGGDKTRLMAREEQEGASGTAISAGRR